MAKGNLLGHINCPVCGYAAGMKITEDKNGQPFGFCEQNCDAQLRIGGKLHRVEKFYRLHPNIKRPGEAPPVAGGGVPVAPAKADATETAKPNTPPTPPAKVSRKAFNLDEV